MSDRILITGGAGYIGSHVAQILVSCAAHVVIFDNLSTGFIENIDTIKFIQGDLEDKDLLTEVIETERINTIMHFAALTSIPESIQHPLKYYQNNVIGTLNLLAVCAKKQVPYFILSSTAAVYGTPLTDTLDEQHPTSPSTPYGYSKLICEKILKNAAEKNHIKYTILRYFNVAGADPTGKIGQRTMEASHLIKVAVQTACHLHPHMPIYGIDYPTPDGTCIRDFIHVNDVANAHVKALAYLKEGGESSIFNCGYGHGFSVKEVIEATEKVIGSSLQVLIAPRRHGDLPRVVADNTRIKTVLGWKPQFDDLTFIINTAFEWEKHLLRR